jgi:hypothetical protein
MGSSPNIEFFGSPFLLRNQFVPVFRMPEHVASDRLKSTSRAIALNPGQHFAQVNHLMFYNPLHGRQSIDAVMPAHSNRVVWLSKGLKQQGCRDRYLVVSSARVGSSTAKNGPRCLAPRARHPGT